MATIVVVPTFALVGGGVVGVGFLTEAQPVCSTIPKARTHNQTLDEPFVGRLMVWSQWLSEFRSAACIE